MKILNLYAGLGGNRKLWMNHEITAIERDSEIAKAYHAYFPQDTILVEDAHAYLEKYYSEFDFIWTSPPCPTHGQYRYNVGFRAKGYKAVYPDMILYEEIIFLKHYFSGYYVVENVRPYYDPLIQPSVIIGRHYFWANFSIPEIIVPKSKLRSKNKISDYNIFDITHTKIQNKRQALRNCVDPILGYHVLSSAYEKAIKEDRRDENCYCI